MYMAKRNIKDAYYCIPIYEPHQNFWNLNINLDFLNLRSFQMVTPKDQENSQNY